MSPAILLLVLLGVAVFLAAVLELDDRSHDNPVRQDADRRKAAICEAARIPLQRLDVNPLQNESELRTLLGLPPLPQRATVFHLRDNAQR